MDINCIQLLLNCGLDIEDNSFCFFRPIESIFVELSQTRTGLDRARKIIEFITTLRYSLEAQSYVPFLYVYICVCSMFLSGNATPPYHLLKPDYRSPFSSRLLQIVTMTYDTRRPIPVKALCYYLWPGGVIQKEDIKQFEQSYIPFMNMIAFMISSAYDFRERPEFFEWQGIVRETLCVSEDLHYFFRHSSAIPTRLLSVVYEGTPLLGYLLSRSKNRPRHLRNSWKPKLRNGWKPKLMHRRLLEWLSLLEECQVDLMKYGKKERKTLMDNYITAPPREWYPMGMWYLKDIRYGAILEDWSLVLDIRVEEFAGEFWDMVEMPRFPMPGTWVDD